jgi:predicted transposase/invertase (TIGR01784 family)
MALQFTEQEVQEMTKGSFFYGVGMKKKAQETAREMLADGLSVETVAKYTGLSDAEIQAL